MLARAGRLFTRRRTSIGRCWREQRGTSLIEVLVAAVVTGIAVTGLALMYSLGGTWVLGRGDNRVANYLAQQKIEALRTLQFICLPDGGPGTTGQQFTPVAPCPVAQQVPQVYNEVSVTPSTGPGQHTFTRLTTVECFAADLSGPVAPPCTSGAKRISVQVIPDMRQTEDVTVRGFCLRSGVVNQDVC